MISAVIVSHDDARLLPRCLQSLGRPRPDELEVVVVDNASSDGTVELVREGFSGVRLLALEENIGFGAAANRGVEVARGDHLLLLNSDAWVVGEAIDLLAERLAHDPGLAMVVPRLIYPDGAAQFVWAPDRGVVGEVVQLVRNRFEGFQWAHRGPVRRLLGLLGPGWYSAACALVRRRAFDQVGGFDVGFFMYFEDADLCVRLRRAGWRLEMEGAAVACHARGGLRPRAEIDLARRRAQVYYYRKHRPRWEQVVLEWHLRRRYRSGPVADWLRSRRVNPATAAGDGRTVEGE